MIVVLCLGTVRIAPTRATENNDLADAAAEHGRKSFARGDFEAAIAHWRDAAAAYEECPGRRVRVLNNLAAAYLALGKPRECLGIVGHTLAQAETLPDMGLRTALLVTRAQAYLASGAPAPVVHDEVDRGLRLARETGDRELQAILILTRADLLKQLGKDGDALELYDTSRNLAAESSCAGLIARALTGAAEVLQRMRRPLEARERLDAAADGLRERALTHDYALRLIELGRQYDSLRVMLGTGTGALGTHAVVALTSAAGVAEAIGDQRALSSAWGTLGHLYEEDHRQAEALQYTRRAILAAQHVDAPYLEFQWQWQTGRLLKAAGEAGDAIEAYRRALHLLQTLRPAITRTAGRRHAAFRDAEGQVFLQMTDLLLQRSGRRGAQEARADLEDARRTMEALKVAELQDYFGDDCVRAPAAGFQHLDAVSSSAVVIYPIVLLDRTELLVSVGGDLKRFVVPVTAGELTEEVIALRGGLEDVASARYLPHAERLYNWLIRPLENEGLLHGADTLLFVPDAALRTIPMAALHDGERFLISRYAVAITPGLEMTDPRPFPHGGVKLLLAGLSVGVQDWPALKFVGSELDGIQAMFGSRVLLNDEFVLRRMEEELAGTGFGGLHIASHGEFRADASESFLLTYDDRLSMDQLSRLVQLFQFGDRPLELLTLSACESAAGDDRAALGLAGIAVKAGAKSALGTLWHIDDRATSELVVGFYRQLRSSAVSKAVALQRAQLELLQSDTYGHPGYWAAFLLINNWL